MLTKYLIGDISEITNSHQALVTKAVHNLSIFYFVFDFENLEKSNFEFIKKVKNDYALQFNLACEENPNSMPNLRKFSYTKPTIDEIKIIKSFNQCDEKVFNIWRTDRLS